MKRHPSLRALSDDHHRALVLARRLRRSAPDPDVSVRAALAAAVRQELDAELEPHFVVEERVLLPALEARGETELVERTLADHARVRVVARGAWSAGTAQELGALLEQHVRFEERVLFPRAEAVLSDAELAAVRDARPGSKA